MSDEDEDTLIIENADLKSGFTQIPNWLLRTPAISRDAKLLYGVLLSYAWQKGSCFPGYETLMEDMCCAREALAKWIKELKDKGLISIRHRGQGKTSIYTIKSDVAEKFDYRTSRSSISTGQIEQPQKFDYRTSSSSENELPVVRKSKHEEYSVKKTYLIRRRESPGDLAPQRIASAAPQSRSLSPLLGHLPETNEARASPVSIETSRRKKAAADKRSQAEIITQMADGYIRGLGLEPGDFPDTTKQRWGKELLSARAKGYGPEDIENCVAYMQAKETYWKGKQPPLTAVVNALAGWKKKGQPTVEGRADAANREGARGPAQQLAGSGHISDIIAASADEW